MFLRVLNVFVDMFCVFIRVFESVVVKKFWGIV